MNTTADAVRHLHTCCNN